MQRVIACACHVDIGRPAPTSETGRLTVALVQVSLVTNLGVKAYTGKAAIFKLAEIREARPLPRYLCSIMIGLVDF